MGKLRRTVLTTAIGLTAALLAGGTASARPPQTSTFADPFGGSYPCAGFEAVYSGQDRGLIEDFTDANGTLVREVGHIHAYETDTNPSTGRSIDVRTNITVHADLNPDGSFSTWAITGEFDMSNRSGQGVVLHDTGRVAFNTDGDPYIFRGVHDTFTKGNEAFCEALS